MIAVISGDSNASIVNSRLSRSIPVQWSVIFVSHGTMMSLKVEVPWKLQSSEISLSCVRVYALYHQYLLPP